MEEQCQQEEVEVYVCPYCGKGAPSGLDHHSLFACCGEIGEAIKETHE
jgi:hypothetical protein